ncbi:hypothetical protein RHMOL_Rhmol09G0064000 [Rhododendron molle]|uniref:Uncharacterized protein n=1 Tax=Rhododendron molle TaxID=49168 RepID=A0ACC0MA98_RHOML|nr:hypothetical protein RHMOL_Rhmol09G0064000 [Rhododendron molle]
MLSESIRKNLSRVPRNTKSIKLSLIFRRLRRTPLFQGLNLRRLMIGCNNLICFK